MYVTLIILKVKICRLYIFLVDDVMRAKKGADMQTDVVISANPQSICMDLVYFFNSASPKNQLITTKVVVTKTNKVVSETKFQTNSEFKWKTERIETNELGAGNYTVKIIFPHENFYIGEIRFCNSGN